MALREQVCLLCTNSRQSVAGGLQPAVSGRTVVLGGAVAGKGCSYDAHETNSLRTREASQLPHIGAGPTRCQRSPQVRMQEDQLEDHAHAPAAVEHPYCSTSIVQPLLFRAVLISYLVVSRAS